MVPTFSINKEVNEPEKQRKVFEMIENFKETSNSNPLIREWIGEAYIRAVTNENTSSINLIAYAQSCERNAKLNKANKKETNLLTQEELDDGFVGIPESLTEYVDDSVEDLISDLDLDNNVKIFLIKREEIFLEKGVDIWRLIELVKLEDKQAQNKLRVIMAEFGIEDLLHYVLGKSACRTKLEGILC